MVFQECDAGFKWQTTLKSHMLTHKEDYKPLQCKECNVSFTKAADLEKHRQFHSGERRFACKVSVASRLQNCANPAEYNYRPHKWRARVSVHVQKIRTGHIFQQPVRSLQKRKGSTVTRH